jgi:L-2,4-diaminobutyrate decarboxylase
MSSSNDRAPVTAPPPLEALHAELARDMGPEAGEAFVRVTAAYFASTASRCGAVSTHLTAPELAVRFAEPLPRQGRPLDAVLARVANDIVPECNKLMDPRYMGHQVSAPLPAAVWAESLVSALNQSMAVWEMSPVATVIENLVIRWMADLAGYGPEAGGTFTSGGTEATFAGLLAARHAGFPDAWRKGVGDTPPVVVCGEHAHYGVARAVGELGVGTDQIVPVPSDHFRMSVPALERTLTRVAEDGRRVMAVVATAGTTATGSFDDLDAIGRVCEQQGLWLHVDGAHGASALFSARHRHQLEGVRRASSITWDPHKMMLLPLAASVVLVRREHDLEAAFSQRAPYLFHAGTDERNWDQGLRTFQCSRRADALKVWIALQRYGADAIGLLYDQLCQAARTLYEQVLARADFEPQHEPESNILCFRYRGDGRTPDAALDDVNLRVRHALNRGGAGWITTTVLNGRRVLRVTVMNPRTTASDTQGVLEALGDLARSV